MESVRALTAGLIDYAGLFPPAELTMPQALENYAGYLRGPDSRSLGRFVVPFNRFDELEATAAYLLPSGKRSAPWRVSVLLGPDVKTAVARLLKFNCEHWEESGIGHAVVDAVEIRTDSLSEISPVRADIPDSFDAYFELTLDPQLERAASEVGKAGARAKIRTGGVTPSAFPTAEQIVRFLGACLAAGIAFKATAGLHHPVRSAYPLTYKPHSERGTMFGFLNVFLAAALLRAGSDNDTVQTLLEETDTGAFRFADDCVSWRGRTISSAEIAETRRAFAISFGSCSFREPIDELALLLSGVTPA